MNRIVARLLTLLYPRHWRNRYGAEFEALLRTGPGDLRTSANVLWAALREHIFPTLRRRVDKHLFSFGVLVRKPSAFLPIAMSLAALAVVTAHIAVFGIAREADEGATAHIWQLLMAGQIPVLVFFAIRWLPRAPRQALYVLSVQGGAVLASMAPVFLLNL